MWCPCRRRHFNCNRSSCCHCLRNVCLFHQQQQRRQQQRQGACSTFLLWNSATCPFPPLPLAAAAPLDPDPSTSQHPSDPSPPRSRMPNRLKTTALYAAGGATVAVGVVTFGLPMTGFTAAGVASGSAAALYQSSLAGFVAKGSMFALAQSAGAGGLSTPALFALASAGAASGAAASR